jgi:hypothetical protein
MLYKEINKVYSDNHMKPINILCGKNTELPSVTAGGTYTLNGQYTNLSLSQQALWLAVQLLVVFQLVWLHLVLGMLLPPLVTMMALDYASESLVQYGSC